MTCTDQSNHLLTKNLKIMTIKDLKEKVSWTYFAVPKELILQVGWTIYCMTGKIKD